MTQPGAGDQQRSQRHLCQDTSSSPSTSAGPADVPPSFPATSVRLSALVSSPRSPLAARSCQAPGIAAQLPAQPCRRRDPSAPRGGCGPQGHCKGRAQPCSRNRQRGVFGKAAAPSVGHDSAHQAPEDVLRLRISPLLTAPGAHPSGLQQPCFALSCTWTSNRQ